MGYHRVLPRDLFNEANLLKCLGKLTCLIHDEMIQGLNVNHENESEGFQINQDPNSGAINCSNLQFFDNNGTPVYFHTPLNDRDKWPLMMEYKGEEYYCFFKNGNWQPWKGLFL